jgi:hypothetical protein
MRKQAGGIPTFSLFWNWCRWINARDCHMISKGVGASGPTRRRCSQLFRGGVQRNCSLKWDDSDRRQNSISTLARSLAAAHELRCVDQDSCLRTVRAPRCGAALIRQTREGTTCAGQASSIPFHQASRDSSACGALVVSRIHETHAIYRQNERLQHGRSYDSIHVGVIHVGVSGFIPEG